MMFDWKMTTDNIADWMDRQIRRIPDQAGMAIAIVCFLGVMGIVLYLLGDLALDLIR